MITNKLVTLVKHPHLAIQKYFRMWVLREILPIYRENYDECWGFTSYEGKVVLDVGADYGSTAYYFLKRGAKFVVAVEGHDPYVKKLWENYGFHSQVAIADLWINCPADFEWLLKNCKVFPVDIAKVDIEGAEEHLVGVEPSLLRTIPEWLIETHRKAVGDKLVTKFLGSNFKVALSNYPIEGVYKILHCAKK